MKKYIYFVLLFIVAIGCNDMKVGYLETNEAVYKPNVLTVRKELDMNDWDDEDRAKWGAHWVSPAIQGILGTNPMMLTIHEVKTEGGGDVAAFLKYTTLRGNGQFDVDFENEIPVGKYIITIKVENEGYTSILKDIFTIEVKQK